MKFSSLFLIIFFSFLSCKGYDRKDAEKSIEISKKSSNLQHHKIKEDITIVLKDTFKITSSTRKIENAIGLVSLVKEISENDTIRIYNQDQSEWYKFSFFYDDTDGKYDFYNPNFSPYAFNPDNFLLYLKVSDTLENKMLEVIVNETTGEKKYIKDSSSILQFQTWEECISNLFAVQFDSEKTPLWAKMGGNSETISYSSTIIYHPNQINDDWLQVKWESENGWKYGWVRWRKNEELLIDPYFSS